ncbi:MAG: hypothetical protein ACI8Y4_001581 [Candidatus Poriferisodalaceae bacterium]|jgi:hypothetical protein
MLSMAVIIAYLVSYVWLYSLAPRVAAIVLGSHALVIASVIATGMRQSSGFPTAAGITLGLSNTNSDTVVDVRERVSAVRQKVEAGYRTGVAGPVPYAYEPSVCADRTGTTSAGTLLSRSLAAEVHSHPTNSHSPVSAEGSADAKVLHLDRMRRRRSSQLGPTRSGSNHSFPSS